MRQPSRFGTNLGLNGAIAIAQASDRQRSTVYLKTVGQPVVSSSSDLIATVTLKLDALRAESLPQSASLELIRKMVDKWTSRLN